MDIANHNTTSVLTLKLINACRLYLKEQYISDIAHISENILLQEYYADQYLICLYLPFNGQTNWNQMMLHGKFGKHS